jgi:hypothetical protein
MSPENRDAETYALPSRGYIFAGTHHAVDSRILWPDRDRHKGRVDILYSPTRCRYEIHSPSIQSAAFRGHY